MYVRCKSKKIRKLHIDNSCKTEGTHLTCGPESPLSPLSPGAPGPPYLKIINRHKANSLSSHHLARKPE